MGLVGLATTASATVIYQYMGPGFNGGNGGPFPDPTYIILAHVSVAFTASSFLPSNLLAE